MASYMTSDDLIKSVKRRSATPENQVTFTDEDFLAFADEETSLGLVPSIISSQEDYFLYTEKIACQANQIRYPIPYRAIGNKLREVAFIDNNGNTYEMTRIGVGDLPFYNSSAYYSKAYAYYIENNDVVLVPFDLTLPNGVFLSMSYYMRPNSLVLLDKVAPITSIDRTTGIIQVSNLPADYNINQKYDLVKTKSPNKTILYDIVPLAINSTSKTVTLALIDIPSNLAVGDHLCMAEQCAIPQVPSDLHVVLAHRVAARCLEAMGDLEGLQAANQKLAEMEVKTQTLIDNRVDDSPKKVVNRHSIMRNGLSRRRFNYRG